MSCNSKAFKKFIVSKRVSAAKYLDRSFGIMCSWGWCKCVTNIFSPMIAHVLGESELEELCDLCVGSLWGFPKVVR